MADTPRVLSSETVFVGKRFVVRHDLVDLPNAGRFQREVIDHLDAVVIVALDEEHKVLLVNQFRAPLGRTNLELPAGTIEREEEPLACAQRELREETGYAAERFRPIGDFWTTPGFCTERMYAFLATGLRLDPLPADDDEDIELVRIPYAEALEMACTGQLPDAKTIATLVMSERYVAL